MKTIIGIFFCAAVCVSSTRSQTTSPPAGWAHTMVSGLNLTQVSFTDWAQGGDNSLAWAVTLEGSSKNDVEMTNWTNNYKLAFGQAKIGSQETRKTDDKIDLETILTYKIGTVINPYAAATLKSQFATGYVYTGTTKKAVSDFFDPAYLTQSVGAGYKPIPEMMTRFGVAVREIITSHFTFYADDPSTTDIEKIKIEGGIESATNAEVKLAENILFTSKVELFAAFKTLAQVVVRSDNTFSAKVNKYIVVNFNVQFINEKAASPYTQVKETLALGLSYTLL